MLPPEPSRTLTLPRSLWTAIGALAAATDQIDDAQRLGEGLARGEPPAGRGERRGRMQHRQNPRREVGRCGWFMVILRSAADRVTSGEALRAVLNRERHHYFVSLALVRDLHDDRLWPTSYDGNARTAQ